MHFLITGHTGFKGSWLALMLKIQGHNVSGISLAPEKKSIYVSSNLEDIFSNNIIQDLSELTVEKIPNMEIDVVIHLAAQSLVKKSYKFPIETYQTNVMGTLKILELTKVFNPIATLIITTDKVYKSNNKKYGHTENDSLGGIDPYSSSKAAADIATQSWRESFSNHPIAIARSGNVIGGGDFSNNRLIPDLIQSFISSKKVILRYPESVRPWQHVLDCLNGYQILIDRQIVKGVSGEWNFGPDNSQTYTVSHVAELAAKFWGAPIGWEKDNSIFELESGNLVLNSDKARKELMWKERLSFHDALFWTVDFYKRVHNGENSRNLMESQIINYLNL